jgi:anti-sigma regulatory factor (Ser/Thr protein kinase)
VSIVLDEDESGLFELDRAIKKLAEAGPGPVKVNLVLRGDTIYVHGLALLAAWCDMHATEVICDIPAPRAKAYLDRLGFCRMVQKGEPVKSVEFDDENYVALTQILPKERSEADEIAGRLTDLFARHIDLSKENRNALTIAMAEMVENVYRHSVSRYPGYILAQAHPKTRKFLLAVADTGIGIQESFKRSNDPEARAHGKTPRDAMQAAVLPLVTSKKDTHAGYGLYVISKLAELNRGTFRLTSGRYTYYADPKRAKWSPDPFLKHEYWQGTFVGLLLDMDGPLNLEKIWKTLPVPAGYEREDFLT